MSDAQFFYNPDRGTPIIFIDPHINTTKGGKGAEVLKYLAGNIEEKFKLNQAAWLKCIII